MACVLSTLYPLITVLPHHGVEVMKCVEAVFCVKFAGVAVFFGDGEGEAAEVAASEFCHAAMQQSAAEAEAAEFRRDAELRDVADVGADAGTQQKPLHEARTLFAEYP